MLFDKKFNWKDFLLNSAIYFISLILIFGILFIIIPESKDNLLAYINKQVVGSLENIVTVESRFFIVKRLLSELIPAFIIATLFLITSRKINIIERKWMFILLILGLSGVFPIMISMKQSGFYILTTYPLFAMALSLLFISNSKILFDKMSFKTYQWIRISSFAILSSAIIFSLLQFNKVSRDKDMLEDIYTLSEIIPEGETISIQAIFYTNWGMHGYFYRTKNISLDPGKELRKYYITPKGEQIKLIHIKNTQLT
jgi:hypothetical protein